MLDELVNSSSGGGSSLIPITIDPSAQHPSIEVSEVLAGLDEGLRYEVTVDNGYGIVINCGELKKMFSTGQDNVRAFAMTPKSGVAGSDTQLTLTIVGIQSLYQGGEWVDTWYVQENCYLSIGYYD